MSTNWDQYLMPSKDRRTVEQFPEWAKKATDNRLKIESVRALAKMALLHPGASEHTLRGYLQHIIAECGPEPLSRWRT